MRLADDPVLAHLRERGFRLTAPRRAVVRVLLEAESWLPPDVVHSRASAYRPGLGLVTVYRTLALLTELGLAHRVHWEDGCHGYTLAKSGHEHHLVCERCHRVLAFGDCDLDRLVAKLESETGFKVESHMLELVGVCPSCQA
jgi:Fur family ferric uptake transcriptional regulator